MFKNSSLNEADALVLKIDQSLPDTKVIPQYLSRMQSLNSITYQEGQIRYNDYYGKLISIFDYDHETSTIISMDLDKTHEVAYLLILSRVGKKLDLKGLHKLHAFAISYRDNALVCMMPTKGGKSTLLMNLLKDPEIKMISDDIPLFNVKGEILPFPIKIGLDHYSNTLPVKDPEHNIYFLKREQYGLKTFISTAGLEEKVEKPGKKFKKVILVEAYRFNSATSTLKRNSLLKTYKGLMKHAVVGVGLPMIMEYFWEFGIKDFFIKAIIFLSRLFAALVFGIRSERFMLFLGKNPEQAASILLREIKKPIS